MFFSNFPGSWQVARNRAATWTCPLPAAVAVATAKGLAEMETAAAVTISNTRRTIGRRPVCRRRRPASAGCRPYPRGAVGPPAAEWAVVPRPQRRLYWTRYRPDGGRTAPAPARVEDAGTETTWPVPTTRCCRCPTAPRRPSRTTITRRSWTCTWTSTRRCARSWPRCSGRATRSGCPTPRWPRPRWTWTPVPTAVAPPDRNRRRRRRRPRRRPGPRPSPYSRTKIRPLTFTAPAATGATATAFWTLHPTTSISVNPGDKVCPSQQQNQLKI